MSSVFSRKITMFTFSGCLTGEGTPSKYCTGRRHTKRSSSCRSATLSDRMPPPTGVVRGPLIPTRNSPKASTVSSGSQVLNWLCDLSLAAVNLFDCVVEHVLRCAPNIGTGAIAFDKRDNRTIGHIQRLIASKLDLLAVSGNFDVLIRHFYFQSPCRWKNFANR